MSEPGFVLVSVEEQARAEQLDIPEALPILPLMETVVLPGTMTPLAVGRESSLALIEDVVAGNCLVGLVLLHGDDVSNVGTAAYVHRIIRVADGTVRIVVHGLRRIVLARLVSDDPYLVS